MSALDKVLALAALDNAVAAQPTEDLAGELVQAARTSIAEVLAYLADTSRGDDKDGDGNDDHSSHATFKALTKRGMDEAKAKALCAKADNRVKAARLAEGALVCLSALDVPQASWAETTAYDHLSAIALTGHGNGVLYADPGYRGKRRLPLDSEGHTRLSLAYAHQASPGDRPLQLAEVRAAAQAAARQFGIALTVDEERIAGAELLGLSALPSAELRKAEGAGLEEAAELVALAKPVGDGGIIMNHAPFTGTHEHGHFQSQVHGHPHQHFGDNSHDGGPAHRPGSKPGGRAGW
jgi:hypothetical protein